MYSLHYTTSGDPEERQFFPLDPQGYGYPQHDARGQDAQQEVAVAVAKISNLGPQVYSVPDTPSSTSTRRS